MNFLTTNILFIAFATNLIASCFLTIFAINAINALIALIFAFVNVSLIFLLMGLEFLGLVFIIVYVGALAVLFLFAVMLFNLKSTIRVKTKTFIIKSLIGLISIYIFYLLIFTFFFTFYNTGFLIYQFDYFLYFLINKALIRKELSHYHVLGFINNKPTNISSLHILGQVLYNEFSIYLISTAFILLIAMIGAVVLINNPKEQIQTQHIQKQIRKNLISKNIK
jgi:NADH:ubiquinone oxidoreductase subunit 6 (subunit J)